MEQEKKVILSPVQKILGEDFNPGLLIIITRKSFIWCVLIVLLTMSSSLLYLRYTTPTYEVGSTLMLKPENTSAAIGFGDNSLMGGSSEDIQRDLQIMKSNIIMDRVMDKLPLLVSYFNSGQILVEEKYKTSPFEIQPTVKVNDIYGVPVSFEFKSPKEFAITYRLGQQKYIYNGVFGKKISTPQFDFTASGNSSYLKGHIEAFKNSKFFFIINSRQTVIKKIRDIIRIASFAPTIIINYQDKNPQRATDIVNAINDEFVAYDKEKKTESSLLILTFIDNQINLIDAEIQALENKVKAFRIKNNLISTGTKEQEIIEAITSIKQQQIELNIKENILESYQLYFDKYKDSTRLFSGVIDPEFTGLLDYLKILDDLQSNKRLKLISKTINNPEVKVVDKQISEIKVNIDENIKNTLKSINEQRDAQNEEMAKYVDEFNRFPEIEAEFEHLQKLIDSKDKYYLLLLDKKAGFSISMAGFISDFVILKRAEPPTIPSSPNVPLIKLLGVVTGIIISFIFVLVRYLLTNKILSISEINKLSRAGLIGVVPIYRKPMDVSQLVVNMSPKSVMSEAFRSIRTNLEYIPLDNTTNKRSVAITSTIAGEGKTFVAVNLAGIFSVAGKKSIILDFDLRKPRIHKAFGSENNKGLSTILIGKYSVEECIKHSEWENLDYITSGPVPPNPAEFIMSKQTSNLIDYLKTKYDVIIMDTPPIGVVTDALELLKRVDYPIYVLRADYSNRNFFNNVNRLVDDNHITRLSVLLNGMGQGASGYSYGYSYGYGYGYGYGGGYGSGYGGYSYGYGYYSDTAPPKKNFWTRIKSFLR